MGAASQKCGDPAAPPAGGPGNARGPQREDLEATPAEDGILPLCSAGGAPHIFPSLAALDAYMGAHPNRIILLIHHRVYDATEFAARHPGGPFVLKKYCNGKDCSATFDRIHGTRGMEKAAPFTIGEVVVTVK